MSLGEHQPTPMMEMTLALDLMSEALDLLDRSEAPAHIGAHLDLAIEQLRAEIAGRA